MVPEVQGKIKINDQMGQNSDKLVKNLDKFIITYYSMSHETGPGQNQKKTESKKVLEYKNLVL